MFVTELTPLFQEFVQRPVAFAGGFFAGALHLNLNEQPVSQWLERQMGMHPTGTPTPPPAPQGPQSISID
jgi:hypothetical protein